MRCYLASFPGACGMKVKYRTEMVIFNFYYMIESMTHLKITECLSWTLHFLTWIGMFIVRVGTPPNFTIND